MFLPAIAHILNRSPLMVRPETPVENVIEQMSQTGASAALVVETPESPEMGQILVGIFTEADIIQLSSIGDRLGGYRIAQIMIRSLVTVQEAELSDPFAIAALLAKHQISHLPVVNEFGGIVGLLTALNLLRQAQIQPLSSPENLNPEPLNPGADSGNLNPGNLNPQNLASTDALVLPADLIQLHQLAPLQTSQVIRADRTASGRELTELLSHHKTNCIVICQSSGTSLKTGSQSSSQVPCGIVTTHDIVQLKALEIDLDHIQADSFCNHPPTLIPAKASVQSAITLMQKFHGQMPLIVVDQKGSPQQIVSPRNIVMQVMLPQSMQVAMLSLKSRFKPIPTHPTHPTHPTPAKPQPPPISTHSEKSYDHDLASLAFEVSQSGVWKLNLKTQEIFYSARWKDILGYPDGEISNRLEEWLSRVHPEDLPTVKSTLKQYLSRNTDLYTVEYRIRCRDGRYKWILDRGKVFRQSAQQSIYMVGVSTELSQSSQAMILQAEGQLISTEHQDRAEAIRQLYQVTVESNVSFEERIAQLLRMGCDRLGMEIGLLGRVWVEHYEVIAAHLSSEFPFKFTQGDTLSLDQTFEREVVRSTGVLYVESIKHSQWRNHPVHRTRHLESYIGTQVIVNGRVYGTLSFMSRNPHSAFRQTDIEMLKLMANYIGSEIARENSQQALQRQNQYLLLMKQITQRVRSNLETQEVFQTTATQIGRIFGVNRCSIYTFIPAPYPHLTCVAEYLEMGYESTLNLEISASYNPYIEKVLAEDKVVASPDVFVDPLLESSTPMNRRAGIKSMLAVRTSYQDEPNGVIMLHQCDQMRQWSQEEIEFLEDVASQVGLTISQAKLLEAAVTSRQQLAEKIKPWKKPD